MRISDWSSDVCSSDLDVFLRLVLRHGLARPVASDWTVDRVDQIAKGLFLLRRIVLGHSGHGHAASLVTHSRLARGRVVPEVPALARAPLAYETFALHPSHSSQALFRPPPAPPNSLLPRPS